MGNCCESEGGDEVNRLCELEAQCVVPSQGLVKVIEKEPQAPLSVLLSDSCTAEDCVRADSQADIEFESSSNDLVGISPRAADNARSKPRRSLVECSNIEKPLKQRKFDFAGLVEVGPQQIEAQLCFNNGDSINKAAERFLRDNELDSCYLADAEKFIAQLLRPRDFTKYIEVNDGRRLPAHWNIDDDPEEVAVIFAEYHGQIHQDELPSIVEHIQEATLLPIQRANLTLKDGDILPEQRQSVSSLNSPPRRLSTYSVNSITQGNRLSKNTGGSEDSECSAATGTTFASESDLCFEQVSPGSKNSGIKSSGRTSKVSFGDWDQQAYQSDLRGFRIREVRA